ncbi:MAG: hypothetical protein AAF225_12495 [Pseudomonadota bacterium]
MNKTIVVIGSYNTDMVVKAPRIPSVMPYMALRPSPQNNSYCQSFSGA